VGFLFGFPGLKGIGEGGERWLEEGVAGGGGLGFNPPPPPPEIPNALQNHTKLSQIVKNC